MQMIDYTTYHHSDHPDVLVIEATGQIDMTAADFMLDCIQGFIDRGEHQFVIDCESLELMTSFGLSMLVRANRRLKEKGGAIAIAGARGLVAQTLHLVHFDRLFHMFPDVDQAAASFE